MPPIGRVWRVLAGAASGAIALLMAEAVDHGIPETWCERSDKRLKLSSSRSGGIEEGQAPEAIQESMILMNRTLRARSSRADR